MRASIDPASSMHHGLRGGGTARFQGFLGKYKKGMLSGIHVSGMFKYIPSRGMGCMDGFERKDGLMQEKTRHKSHDDVAKRLRRAGGHLNKVVAMIEEGAPCVDVAGQLHAVYRAVHNAKQVLIRDHIDHCLDEHAIKERSAAEIKAELAEITKYL